LFTPIIKLIMCTLLDLIGVQEQEMQIGSNFYSSHKNWLDDHYRCATSKRVIIYLNLQFKIISIKSNPVAAYLVELITNWDMNLKIPIGIIQNILKMEIRIDTDTSNRIVLTFPRRLKFVQILDVASSVI
jgi:hypothetical protein